MDSTELLKLLNHPFHFLFKRARNKLNQEAHNKSQEVSSTVISIKG